MSSQFGFTAADYSIFAGIMAMSIGIGIYHARRGGEQIATSEYFLANGRLKMLPVALSLLVSFQSSITLLGHPAEVYLYGPIVIWSTVGLVLATILVGRTAGPLFHPLKLTSAFEYFELRYKAKAPRTLGTIIGIIYNTVYMGVVLYGPALALEAVADFPFWASVLSTICASVLYTSIGGLKAVIWTDVLQCFVILIGIIAVMIKGMIDVGSVHNVVKINNDNLRLLFFDFDPDPTVRQTFWSLLVGTSIGQTGLIFSQATVQRIGSVKTEKDAKTLIYLVGPGFLFIGIIVTIQGLVMFAYFNDVGCDPIKGGFIKNPNQLSPYMVIRLFHDLPGLSGIYLACLFSASLSTISSGLNSLSAQTVKDIVQPLFENMSDRKSVLVAKISVLFYGCLTLVVTAVVTYIPGSLTQITSSVMASISGPLAGLFFFSALCPWATKKGFLVGGSVSSVFVFCLSLGYNLISKNPKQPWLPMNPVNSCPSNSTIASSSEHGIFNDTVSRIAAYEKNMLIYNAFKPEGIEKLFALTFRWFGAIGVLTSIFVGSVVSLITGHPPLNEVDSRYILPLGDTLFPYLPKKARVWLEFGVNFNKRKLWLERLKENVSNNGRAERKDDPELEVLDPDRSIKSLPKKIKEGREEIRNTL